MEDAIYESQALRDFVEIDRSRELVLHSTWPLTCPGLATREQIIGAKKEARIPRNVQ